MSSEDKERQKSIWLEATNVRVVNGAPNGVEIQVKGDKADREPVWWNVNLDLAFGKAKTGVGSPPDALEPDHNAAYRTIAEGLDKKRIVLAMLAPVGETLECTLIRVQYAESNSR